jgi:hypothetical protein
MCKLRAVSAPGGWPARLQMPCALMTLSMTCCEGICDAPWVPRGSCAFGAMCASLCTAVLAFVLQCATSVVNICVMCNLRQAACNVYTRMQCTVLRGLCSAVSIALSDATGEACSSQLGTARCLHILVPSKHASDASKASHAMYVVPDVVVLKPLDLQRCPGHRSVAMLLSPENCSGPLTRPALAYAYDARGASTQRQAPAKLGTKGLASWYKASRPDALHSCAHTFATPCARARACRVSARRAPRHRCRP